MEVRRNPLPYAPNTVEVHAVFTTPDGFRVEKVNNFGAKVPAKQIFQFFIREVLQEYIEWKKRPEVYEEEIEVE